MPVWAERATPTTWHPQHIAERYGLFTLIVLGESILAATVAVQAGARLGRSALALLPIIVGGLLIVFSMWWMYFDRPVHDLLTSLRKAFMWGYGHYVVFASAAAVGAGLAVSRRSGDASREGRRRWAPGWPWRFRSRCSSCACGFCTTGRSTRQTRWFGPIAAGLVLLTPLTGLRRAAHRRDSGRGCRLKLVMRQGR